MPTRTKKTTKQTVPLHHRVKLAVLPHKKNRYMPHILHGRGLAMFMIATLSLLVLGMFQEKGSTLGQSVAISQQQLLAQTNAERQANGGLEALTLNKKLNHAAQLKAEDMFRNNYWAHVSPAGVTPWVWIHKSGYEYSYAGENLAKGFRSATTVTTAWMNSPEHRANILNSNYTDVGFAVKKGLIEGETTTVIVAEYATPQTTAGIVGTLLTPGTQPQNALAQIGVGLQSMNPTMLGAIVLLLGGAGLSLVAHRYRDKLPLSWRTSWKRHHGIFKALGMVSFVIVILALYGSGQI